MRADLTKRIAYARTQGWVIDWFMSEAFPSGAFHIKSPDGYEGDALIGEEFLHLLPMPTLTIRFDFSGRTLSVEGRVVEVNYNNVLIRTADQRDIRYNPGPEIIQDLLEAGLY